MTIFESNLHFEKKLFLLKTTTIDSRKNVSYLSRCKWVQNKIVLWAMSVIRSNTSQKPLDANLTFNKYFK